MCLPSVVLSDFILNVCVQLHVFGEPEHESNQADHEKAHGGQEVAAQLLPPDIGHGEDRLGPTSRCQCACACSWSRDADQAAAVQQALAVGHCGNSNADGGGWPTGRGGTLMLASENQTGEEMGNPGRRKMMNLPPSA
eukprot:1074319-Pelagomonas_calceolata.AAC.3